MTRMQRVWMMIGLLRECWHPHDELARRFGVSARTIRDDLLLIEGEPFCQPVQRRMACCIAQPAKDGGKPAT